MIIYKTTNLIDGMFYVGQHNHANDNYLGSGTALKEAIKKYGKENFTRKTLEECLPEEADIKEQYWIRETKAVELGYNKTKFAKGIGLVSDATKEKMSKAKVGKNHPMYGISRYGKDGPMFGKRHTEETKRKMRENHADVSGKNHPMYGRRHTQETRRKMSKWVRTPEMRKKMRESAFKRWQKT